MEISQGCACSISKTLSWQIGSKAIQAKRFEINGTYIFHLEILFGNFGLPLKKYCFPEKISVQEDKINLPFTFHLHLKLPDFFSG